MVACACCLMTSNSWGRRGGGLGQQVNRHTDLADVVNDGRQVQHAATLFAQTQMSGQGDGDVSDAALVPDGVGVALGQGSGQGFDDLLQHVFQVPGCGGRRLSVCVFACVHRLPQLDGQESEAACALVPATQPMRPADTVIGPQVQTHRAAGPGSRVLCRRCQSDGRLR